MNFFKSGLFWTALCLSMIASGWFMRSLSTGVAAVAVVGLATLVAGFYFALTASGPVAPANPVVPQTQPTKRSSIVTGNGFGFAVLATTGEVSKFYAHPYRFTQPDKDPKKEGEETASFVSRMSWSGPAKQASAPVISYLNESHVLSAKSDDSEQFYFMPFGVDRNVLVTVLRSAKDDQAICLRPTWAEAIEQQELADVGGRSVRWLKFHDTDESLALVSLDAKPSAPADPACLGGQSWAFIVLEDKADLKNAVTEVLRWQNNVAPDALPAREVQAMEDWRVAPRVSFASDNERRVWRQSESVLRMAQSREPNTADRFNNGMIVASLPGEGGFFIPWVRDMAYATVALSRMGHREEARKALMAYFSARPVGSMRHETRGYDYQVSVVRYFGNGSEEADYSGMATPNVELDDWGLVLWAVSEYWQGTKDTNFLSTPTQLGSVYQSMRDYIVHPLLGNTDAYGNGLIVAADSSLWEESQEHKRHHAYATIAAIRGLRGFLRMATEMHDDPTVKLVTEKLKLLEGGFASAFIPRGVVRGTVETSFKNEIDGSVIEAFNFRLVSDRGVIQRTLEKMESLKTASGGYRRVRGDTEYEKQEFLFIDFNMARVLYNFGKSTEATAMLTRIVDKACADNGQIPEMYVSEKNAEFVGEIGDPTGAIPMVGYGAGMYVLTLIERRGR